MCYHRIAKYAPILASAVAAIIFSAKSQAATIDFEDLKLSPQSAWVGPDKTGQKTDIISPYSSSIQVGKFTSGGVNFSNSTDLNWGSWAGWTYSNMTYNPGDYVTGDFNPGDGSNGNTHPVPTGWSSQYYAVTGGDAGGSPSSANYTVGYVATQVITNPDVGTVAYRPTITFTSPTTVSGAFFSNNNWAYYSMLEGDPPSGWGARKFSHENDNGNGDYLDLKIVGKDYGGTQTGIVDFFLADFRDPDPNNDYIINKWTWVDLSSLGDNVASLEFRMLTSDKNTTSGYPNTPTYFVMDNLTVDSVPEPGISMLLCMVALGLGIWKVRVTISD